MTLPTFTDADIQSWINQLGYGNFAFDGDFTGRDASGSVMPSLLMQILGAQQATGVSDAQLASALGGNITPETIADVRDNYTPENLDYSDRLAAYGRGFINEYGMGDSSLVDDRYLTTINPDGTYSTAERGATTGGSSGGGISPRERAMMASQYAPQAPQAAARPAPTLNTAYTPSPYLTDQLSGIGDQISDQFNRQIMPALRASAIGGGHYGGAKQGVAEGIAAGDAADAFNRAGTNLLAGDYRDWMGRELQKYGLDQGYDTSQRGLDLGYLQSDRSYDLGGRGLDLQKYGIDQNTALGWGGLENQRYGIDTTADTARYGMDLNYDLGNQGQMLGAWDSERDNDRADLGMGASLYSMGTMGPWGPLGSYGNLLTGIGGQNSNSSSGGQSGGGWGGALGGGLLGASLGRQFGWF